MLSSSTKVRRRGWSGCAEPVRVKSRNRWVAAINENEIFRSCRGRCGRHRAVCAASGRRRGSGRAGRSSPAMHQLRPRPGWRTVRSVDERTVDERSGDPRSGQSGCSAANWWRPQEWWSVSPAVTLIESRTTAWRMDPSFSEKSLGFKSFSDFLRSRSDIVELDESSTTRMVRLRGFDA